MNEKDKVDRKISKNELFKKNLDILINMLKNKNEKSVYHEIDEQDKKILLSGTETNRRNTKKEDDKVNEDFNYSLFDLDIKVDEFIDWYYENMVKGHYTEIGEYHKPREMRNLIEKMAVWYELRYPEYEINRLMHCCGQESTEVNSAMFKDNQYICDLLDNNSDIKDLDWDEFYNAHAFFQSLPCDEKRYFKKYKFRSIVYIDKEHWKDICLTKNGYVEDAHCNIGVDYREIEGLHIKDVIKLLKENGITLEEGNDLEKELKDYNKWNYQREGILNSVMYRIIERGGNRIGPRRAFLFAKEFNRNIDIPMIYGVDRSDSGLRLFINEYIKAGGSKDLVCLNGYFSKAGKNEKINTITISELIEKQNNAVTFYTPEEDELHQRLVNALASNIDNEVVRQEEIKRLRLKRKIEKSMRNKKN